MTRKRFQERAVSASLDRRSENIGVLPIVISELELGDIERHIFAAHFVECADNAAFEDRPEAFDGLSMDCSDDILTSRVVNSRVWIILVKRIVAWILIGAKQADFMGNGFADEGGESSRINISDHARNHISLAADRADDRRFAGTNAACSAAAALIPMPIFGQAANESFVDFDNTAELVNVLHKRGSDLMAHEPSGFIGTETHVAIDLQSAHAFLANEHKMDDAIPFAKRLIRVLEYRSSKIREAVGNTLSAIHTLPLEGHRFEFVDVPASATRAMDATGQRRATRYAQHAGSSGNSFSNCADVSW
jgi:hypothetical protein